jgi:hypothetical protein
VDGLIFKKTHHDAGGISQEDFKGFCFIVILSSFFFQCTHSLGMKVSLYYSSLLYKETSLGEGTSHFYKVRQYSSFVDFGLFICLYVLPLKTAS